MYRVISRLIILPILSVRNLLIAIWAYRVSLLYFIEIGECFVFLLSLIHGKSNFYIVPSLLILTIISVPIVPIGMGGYAAYVGYLLVFAMAIAIPLIGGLFVASVAMFSAIAESSKPVTDVSRYQ